MSKIILGTDAEFVFEKDGQFVHAHNLINDHYCGFGCDGHSDIAEIRPGYSESLVELTAKIEKTMAAGNTRLGLDKKTDKWLAGHYKHNEPLGAHIHICYPQIGDYQTMDSVLRDYVISGAVGYLLDYYIGTCLEDLLAPIEERFLRRTRGYGRLFRENSGSSAIECKDSSRIEYRTPGSWLLHPSVAYTYLFVTKAALTIYDMTSFRVKKTTKLPKDGEEKAEKLRELIYDTLNLKIDKETRGEFELGKHLMEEVLNLELDWNEDIRGNWL